MDLSTVALSAGSAILATLLTIFLTPSLQHHFWKHRRREELRLAVINEVNKLAAEYIENYMEAEASGNQNFKPSIQWFQAFQAATAQVKALFSDATFKEFKKLEVMIGPNLGPSFLNRTVDDFIQARDTALRSFYKEVGVLP